MWKWAVLSGLVLVAAFGGCQSMSTRQTGMVGDDADTTARVKAAIATTNVSGIAVTTYNGTVYLDGSPKDMSAELQVLDAAQKAAPGHRINSFMAPMH
jgi:osmotically-inducible protein OsmY